ncbi:hypothetical protein YB2330_003869 [Saitoella coloradoensis]
MSSNLTASNLFNLSGKVAVVTGGATGLGLMMSEAFAANGATVYILGRRLEALQKTADVHNPSLESKGGKLIPLQCDVTSKDSLKEVTKKIEEQRGKVNMLVVNSGVSGPRSTSSLKDHSNPQEVYECLFNDEVEEWDQVLRTNVAGAYFTTVAFIPLLAKGNDAGGYQSQVITIASIGGLSKQIASGFSYSASKAAAVHLGRNFSNFLIPLKIRSNIICPGLFPSEMTTPSSGDNNKSSGSDLPKERVATIPAGRAGTEEDMAQTALFLACCGFTNGSIVTVDGGSLSNKPSAF